MKSTKKKNKSKLEIGFICQFIAFIPYIHKNKSVLAFEFGQQVHLGCVRKRNTQSARTSKFLEMLSKRGRLWTVDRHVLAERSILHYVSSCGGFN
jgi:hypothetical protein